jgi:hypothetical protein
VYIFRDIVPLATQHAIMDRRDGWLAAARFSLLFFSGILIPIVLPCPYQPIDPKVKTWHTLVDFFCISYCFERILKRQVSSRLHHGYPELPSAMLMG